METRSGIRKRPIQGSIRLNRNGLVDDEQGDRVRHGGPEKALHHYPADHYQFWRIECPGAATLLGKPGAFGENISSRGITEEEVCVGEVFLIGTAVIQVSQGRQPCWRLNERFGMSGIAPRVQESGRSGWYYRILEEGDIEAGDVALLLERPEGDWTIRRLWEVMYRDAMDLEVLGKMAGLETLSQSWRELARQRISRRTVEDWRPRLDRPDA